MDDNQIPAVDPNMTPMPEENPTPDMPMTAPEGQPEEVPSEDTPAA